MNVIDKLVEWSRREASTARKLVSLAIGIFVFLCALPALFTWAGLVLGFPPIPAMPLAAAIAITLGFLVGSYWLGWAAFSQWRRGHGTPAPTAPTQRLVVEGPYRLCRNPIELGAIFYYLGFGTLFGSLSAGVFASLAALASGSAYHKLVEERELLARFGDEYRRYRKRTPFLIPDLRALLRRRR
jgi:protein-S-isoprenylcysteine O-methyltransferase Ste14